MLKAELEEAKEDDPSGIKSDHKELKEAYRKGEIFWKQKSRNLWLKEGHNNSKIFHTVTKKRRVRNRIIGLERKRKI